MDNRNHDPKGKTVADRHCELRNDVQKCQCRSDNWLRTATMLNRRVLAGGWGLEIEGRI